MEQHFNGLTPAEDERLSLLLEEMGGVIQIIGKIKRHGYASCDPMKRGGLDNRGLLEKELGDVYQAVDMLSYQKDLSDKRMKNHVDMRWFSVVRYLHHQPFSMFKKMHKRIGDGK